MIRVLRDGRYRQQRGRENKKMRQSEQQEGGANSKYVCFMTKGRQIVLCDRGHNFPVVAISHCGACH
jgi:hypothetical protein